MSLILCEFTPLTGLLGLLLCPWMWGILFWWDPTFSCHWLFIGKLQFWSSHRRRWVHILHRHLAMQRWEDHSLDYMGTFVGRVMSLLFSTLSKLVTAFLPRSNLLLTSWLQSPSSMILEPKKRKSVTTSTFSLSTCHEAMGLDAMILVLFCFNV